MRTFYIFKINNEIKSLTRSDPYNLFKTFDTIYNFNKKDLNIAYDMFKEIAVSFNKKKLNISLFDNYRHNLNYIKFNNIHIINNYYTDENSELTINKSHLKIKTSKEFPVFFKDLKSANVFVCDFQNKDYFWIDCVV